MTFNNVDLTSRDKFIHFFSWLAEMNEYHPVDFICEFFESQDFVSYDDEEDEEVLNENFDEYYLGYYYISVDDSFDRMGDVKTRLAIKLNQVSHDPYKITKRINETKKEYNVLAKQWDNIRNLQVREVTKSEATLRMVEEFDYDAFKIIDTQYDTLLHMTYAFAGEDDGLHN